MNSYAENRVLHNSWVILWKFLSLQTFARTERCHRVSMHVLRLQLVIRFYCCSSVYRTFTLIALRLMTPRFNDDRSRLQLQYCVIVPVLSFFISNAMPPPPSCVAFNFNLSKSHKYSEGAICKRSYHIFQMDHNFRINTNNYDHLIVITRGCRSCRLQLYFLHFSISTFLASVFSLC